MGGGSAASISIEETETSSTRAAERDPRADQRGAERVRGQRGSRRGERGSFMGALPAAPEGEDQLGLGEGDAAALGDHLGVEPLRGEHHRFGILGRAGDGRDLVVELIAQRGDVLDEAIDLGLLQRHQVALRLQGLAQTGVLELELERGAASASARSSVKVLHTGAHAHPASTAAEPTPERKA